MEGPDSSYSLLAIHICWNVDRDARMDPPIQTEYLRSGGATTLTCRRQATFSTCAVNSSLQGKSTLLMASEGKYIMPCVCLADDVRSKPLIVV